MRRPLVWVGLAVMLVALNLRAPVASVGPVLREVRAGLGLSGTSTAVFTMLPVLCFGLLAVVAPWVSRRLGMESALMLALVMLTVGLGSRVWGDADLLLVGTAVVGGSIAIANVLLPPLIKRDFGASTGVMMGFYTMCMAGSAAIGAGATVPLGEFIELGWQGGLAIWALPAAAAAVAWVPMLSRNVTPQRATGSPSGKAKAARPAEPAKAGKPGNPAEAGNPGEPGNLAEAGKPGKPAKARPSLVRRPLAWQVTVYFGLQSLMFYAMLAWLPSIYRDHGYSPAGAGFLLSLCGLVQIPVTLLLPRFAIRAASQVPHIVVSTAFMGAGLLGILVAPTAAPYLWVTLFGIGCGACFALGLALFVLRTSWVEETARLSAMAQSIGYLICACGPLLFGLVHDLTHSWSVPLILLLLLLVPQLYTGMLAGRPRVVYDAPKALAASPVSPASAAEASPAVPAETRAPIALGTGPVSAVEASPAVPAETRAPIALGTGPVSAVAAGPVVPAEVSPVASAEEGLVASVEASADSDDRVGSAEPVVAAAGSVPEQGRPADQEDRESEAEDEVDFGPEIPLPRLTEENDASVPAAGLEPDASLDSGVLVVPVMGIAVIGELTVGAEDDQVGDHGGQAGRDFSGVTGGGALIGGN